MKTTLLAGPTRLVIIATLTLTFSARAQDVVTLDLDATAAPQRILHAHLRIPAQPGAFTLVYPKWLPGEHMPSGPIPDLTGFKFVSEAKTLEWRRDDVDMNAIHLEIPSGANSVEVWLDYILPLNSGAFSDGASSTAKLVDLNWNQTLLYPQGSNPSVIQFKASLKLPPGWKYATALHGSPDSNDRSGQTFIFAPVSLETLVDSPVIAGEYLKTIDLWPGQNPPRHLNIVADSAAALDIKPEDSRHFSRLVAEAEALFGAHHFRSYDFLLTLSDHVASFGLEHHESSDDREGEKYLTDSDDLTRGAYLLPHEMVHSWNGKYRRPAGLATPDYQQPMKDDLLWVYEGLTDYLGVILSARSGLWTNDNFCEYLALEAATLDREPGRTWRSLSDTAVSSPFLYLGRSDGASWRRGTDFYEEGDLLWLEADVIIRQQTQGRRSIDDFCHLFHGAPSGPPKVVPYTYEDVVNALNQITPYDWNQFFQTRVFKINPRAPMGGVEGAGWHLVYTDTPSDMQKSREGEGKYTDMTFSLGMKIDENGGVIDVLKGSPAQLAGIGPGMKLVAVNSRAWTSEILRAAVKSAKSSSEPIELLIENSEYFKTCKLDYHDGEKYPHLERLTNRPDLLAEILKPHAAQ